MAAVLRQADGAGEPLRIGRRITIGRDPNSDLPLAGDESVSREHARIRRTADGFSIEDLGSRNGTVIERNGQALPVAGTVGLEPGDLIRIGASRFVFDLTDDPDPADAADLPSSTHVPNQTVEGRTGARPIAPPPSPVVPVPGGSKNRIILIAASLVVAIVAVIAALVLARLLA